MTESWEDVLGLSLPIKEHCVGDSFYFFGRYVDFFLKVGMQPPCMDGSEEQMIDSGNLLTTKNNADIAHTAEDWPLGDGLILAQLLGHRGLRASAGAVPSSFSSLLLVWSGYHLSCWVDGVGISLQLCEVSICFAEVKDGVIYHS